MVYVEQILINFWPFHNDGKIISWSVEIINCDALTPNVGCHLIHQVIACFLGFSLNTSFSRDKTGGNVQAHYAGLVVNWF